MEDEFTLMDVFNVLARRWKLIVAVTLIPVIVVTGVLLLAIKPTFTSTATVLVSQQSVVPPDLGPLPSLTADQPVATVATYVSLAQDPELYRRVIEQLQLSGETASSLAQAVKVTAATDTNMITIKVKLGDKDLAAAVANAVAEQLVERAKGLIVAEQLSSYRAYLLPVSVDIQAQQTALAAKRAALVGVPKVLTTMQSIVNDQTLLDVAKATSNQSVLDLAGLSMVSQQVNPLWVSLTSDVSNISANIKAETGLQALCKQIIAQLESASTDNDSQLPIQIEQRAIPADEKDAGGRSTTVAVTLVAALFLSILLAFLIDYIQTARAAEAEARRAKES
ncbi:MAG TPA: Wzz/FepE/Etk N-terminal domain-containing protein [Candidatus Deferrimicrobium sp.]|nr:Wzz/FepE/Etk N-terminal domain-containing protein [Candidatus Deferrimicrobium sp.]